MKIGLIDVDGHNYPNLPLMKISSYYKHQGDIVTWYNPLTSGHMDIVYMSKVFSFTPDYQYFIDADKVIKGGLGYCIVTVDGQEIFLKNKDYLLPAKTEHMYPDYSLYPQYTKNTAYGFLTRGCPRQCKFCHVGAKEGIKSYKVSDLSEFWRGQRNIVIMDPNLLACKDADNLLQQLIDSKAYIDFNQGLDIRLMTAIKALQIKRLKIKQIHFAWDNYSDIDKIVPKLKLFKQVTGWNKRKMGVYILTNFDTTIEQDLERVYTLCNLGYHPYVMIYNKQCLPPKHRLRQLQRWANNRVIFETVRSFKDYVT